jgi:hypothetical protein
MHVCDTRIAQVCPGRPERSKPDVTLSTGLVVTHRYMCNGATQADSARIMTDAEWEEYCAILKSKR